MTSDSELLRSYAEKRSEEAFAELVKRNLNLVYSAALRQVNGDAHLAQDVSQLVFADLARKAAALSQRQVLAGWLYTSTYFAATRVVRTERRRRTREQEAHAMEELLRSPASDWETLRLVLDKVMHELQESDRDVILMRYFENRQLADIGERLGLSEDGARKKVDRALAKLRTFLSKRGVTATATLATVLSTNAVQVAPVGLAAMLTSASLVSAGVAPATFTFLKLMTMTKLQAAAIGAIVVTGLVTPWVLQHQAQARLREENDSLRQQTAQLRSDNESLSNRLSQATSTLTSGLPAPRIAASGSAASAPPEDLSATNLYARYKDKQPKLTAEQVEPYLKANGRNAASLLAAYRTTGNPALLEEAMQNYPNDPQVAFEAAFRSDAPPGERRQWLEAFKKSVPENALPNYLSALDYFKAGQPDQAVQELNAASAKQPFRDYTMDRIQDDYEAYLSAGYPVAAAETISSRGLLLPQLAQVKELGLDMVDLANSYRTSGDQASAQAILQMAATLGQRYGNTVAGETEVSRLVGMFVERSALNAMDPTSPYGSDGQTVQDRMNQLSQQKDVLNQLNQQAGPLLPTMSDQGWISYKERWKLFGEEAALRWVVSTYGHQ